MENCSAVRYCGITFSYTSATVLLNYRMYLYLLSLIMLMASLTTLVSPPHAVGLANGLAQSVVSLARFLGPVSFYNTIRSNTVLKTSLVVGLAPGRICE